MKKSGIVSIILIAVALFAFPVSADITHCGIWNESDRLTQAIVATDSGPCITVGADDVQIDCNGFSITFDILGQGNASAINITQRLNTNVTNCVIYRGNSSATYTGIYTAAINVTESNFTNIRNVTF